MAEVHGKGAPALGCGSDRSGITEHLGKRDAGSEHLDRAFAGNLVNLSLPCI